MYDKYLNFFAIVVDISQKNLGICPKTFLANGNSLTLLNNSDTLTDNVAAISSSIGMQMYFRGLTLDFPIGKHSEFSLDHHPILSKRVAHSLLLKHPKNGGWNFSLSS